MYKYNYAPVFKYLINSTFLEAQPLCNYVDVTPSLTYDVQFYFFGYISVCLWIDLIVFYGSSN